MSQGSPGTDFIRQIVARDVEAGKHGGRVVTRFPPEPNGFLHIGHAKAVCLDFDIAREHGGTCNLRMDDTNPTTEDPRYVEAIARDVRWLGYEWDGPIRYASDYFPALYALAEQLIRDGLAYVDSLSEEEIREYRGTVTTPGRPSPWRDRSPEESLELFRGMRAGRFENGEHVLRARIDMAADNMKMRDPPLYRIRHATHYRTGDDWPIYPMYDWAHPLSDAIEGITHSFCTLEFEVNRPLYDWSVDHTRPSAAGLPGASSELGGWDPRPRQYEFARLNLEYTIMSKRKLATLVREGMVEGWDDPRMPTLAGLRRRGVPPEAVRAFCGRIGVSKADQRVDIGKLEYEVRDALNRSAPRAMGVLRPLRLVVESWPEGETDWLEAPTFPDDVAAEGTRRIPFTRELWIERDDFREDPPEGFWRLSPGREVRLRHGYLVTCTGVERDAETGVVTAVRCTHDPESRGGDAPDGRQVRGTIHWVSAAHARPATVRLYDRLFSRPDPEAGGADFRQHLNPDSLEVLEEARVEPALAELPEGEPRQWERVGYFVRDRAAGTEGGPLVFSRVVALRDTWSRRRARREASGEEGGPGGAAPEAAGESDRAAGAGATEGVGPPEGKDRSDRRSEARDRARAASRALAETYRSFREELGLSREDADILTGEAALAGFFEEALEAHPDPQPVANWLIHDLRGAMGDRALEDLPFDGRALGRLVALVEGGTLSQPAAKEVLGRMLEGGEDPRRIVEEQGLERIADRERLGELIERLLARHPDEAARYREGQAGLLGFFVGQAMRETDGRADPEVVKALLAERLDGP